jgi:hypothetical protein
LRGRVGAPHLREDFAIAEDKLAGREILLGALMIVDIYYYYWAFRRAASTTSPASPRARASPSCSPWSARCRRTLRQPPRQSLEPALGPKRRHPVAAIPIVSTASPRRLHQRSTLTRRRIGQALSPCWPSCS